MTARLPLKFGHLTLHAVITHESMPHLFKMSKGKSAEQGKWPRWEVLHQEDSAISNMLVLLAALVPSLIAF